MIYFFENSEFTVSGLSNSIYFTPTSTPVGMWDFFDYRAMWNQPINSTAQTINWIPANPIYFPFGQIYP